MSFSLTHCWAPYPPPERRNYTSGWRRLQLLWLACSVPSILPAHFRLFSLAVLQFILESITIIASLWGFNKIHLILDVRERTKTWKNLRDVTWVVYAVGSAETSCWSLNHIDMSHSSWFGYLTGMSRGHVLGGAIPGVLRGGPGTPPDSMERLDLLFGLEMTDMSCKRWRVWRKYWSKYWYWGNQGQKMSLVLKCW